MPIVEFNRAPSHSQLRVFGLILLAVFGIVGMVLIWQFDSMRAARIAWGLGLGLAVLFYAVPPLRLPMYLVWMHALAPIGWLVSHLVLALIYYLVLTPTGVVMRLFGRDVMFRRFDDVASTYWVEHDPGTDSARYFRQS